MTAQLKRLFAAVGLAVAIAFVATAAEAQKPTKRAGAGATTKKKKKKKGGKKKVKASETPVDLGDLDDPPSAPAPAVSGQPGAPTKGKDDDDDDDNDDDDDDHQAKPAAKTARPITVALLMGAGLNATACGTGTCNAYGFGLGLRGGYTLTNKLYLGGTFVYHLGYTTQVAVGTFTRGYAGGVGYLGPEVGYDLTAGPIVVRPYGGLGVGLHRQTVTDFGAAVQPVEAGGARFAFWPGITGMYPLSPTFFVGADARFVLIADGASGFSLFATGGMRL